MFSFHALHGDERRSPRLSVLFGLLFVAFAALEWRLFHLQVLRHPELEDKAEAYQFTIHTEQSWRGPIKDCNGNVLAVTVPARDIYADPLVWSNRIWQLAGIVAPLLGTNQAAIAQRVTQRFDHHEIFPLDPEPGAVLLKRDVSPDQWKLIRASLDRCAFGLDTNELTSRQRALLKSLRRWTLFAVNSQQRFYPYGDLLAPQIGFVGDGADHLLQGKWGLEGFLDSTLAGVNGIRASSQDAAGNELAFCRVADYAPRDGAEVDLTIDVQLQKIVMQALRRVMERYHPSNASCVVIRPGTGEILAMASLPSFDPQAPGACPPACWRNHVVSDANEPGSVFKAVTLATALDRRVVTLDQSVNCENGLWRYKGIPLRDDDHHYGTMPLWEGFAKSSNIALAKTGVMTGTNALYDSILQFGFNHTTGVPMLYETPGEVHPPKKWSASAITRVPIGQELTVSQMQLAMAYAAIANDGRLMRPMLVKQLNFADGSVWTKYQPQFLRMVVRPETARLVRQAMRQVVLHGTGQLADIPGESVIGKTGTAQKLDCHGLLTGHYYCSFIGMFPEDKPELVIAVAVDDPGVGTYGGTVAAPVFREIAEQAMVHYGLHPDLPAAPARPGFFVRSATSARRLLAYIR